MIPLKYQLSVAREILGGDQTRVALHWEPELSTSGHQGSPRQPL